MSGEALSAFIAEYIAGRRQTKLEAFDKEAAKRSDTDSATLAAERRELELRYEPKAWLTDAAKRAGQINLVTHAAKFTHGDSKSSSIYSEAVAQEGYLSTAALSGLDTDAVGNAAALDVAKLLQTRVDGGDSLLASLKRGDHAALAAFADGENQLREWIAGFSRALTPGEPASHKLAKQGYFPVGEGYHLLSPLFATSLVHAMHQKMIAFRFGDVVKAIWKARRERTWHPAPLALFPDAAVLNRKIFPISTACAVGGAGYFPVSLRRGKEQKRRQQIYVLFSPRVGSLTVVPGVKFSCWFPCSRKRAVTPVFVFARLVMVISICLSICCSKLHLNFNAKPGKIGRLTAPI